MEHHRNFLESEFSAVAPQQARWHIIPVAVEETVTYGKGTAAGPQAIIDASYYLEAFNGENCPGEHGIYTSESIHENWQTDVGTAVKFARECQAVPFLLGGEHSITVPAIRALKEVQPEFGILHFDAHADLRYEYENSKMSHACAMRRCHELGIPIVQIGTRAYSVEELKYRQENSESIFYYDAKTLKHNHIPEEIFPKNFPQKIYISFDIDALNPAIIPATGTPEPGGITWYQALDLLQKTKTKEIIGMDLVEFAPIKGFHCYDMCAATLAYEMMALCQ